MSELRFESRESKIRRLRLYSRHVPVERLDRRTFVVDRSTMERFEAMCVERGMIWDEEVRRIIDAFVLGQVKDVQGERFRTRLRGEVGAIASSL